MMNSRLERCCLVIAFGLPLGIYFYTSAPGPFWEDSATFSMAAATLSIPHSPGFPLWVLIGKLFTWLVPENPARATNMMCGLFGAAAAALFYLCANKILFNLSTAGRFSNADTAPNPSSSNGVGKRRGELPLAALGAALVFAFSQTVWLQSVRAEVYSLQLALTLSALLIALSLRDAEKPTQLFLLGAYLWGLSAAVHPLQSVAVVPGLLLLGCFHSENRKKELFKCASVLGLLVLCAAVYLYLPLRSINHPYLNWNQPDTWNRFLAAVTRSGSWKASIIETPANVSYPNMMRLALFLFSEYSAPFWLFAFIGAIRLGHQLPKTGLGLLVLLLSNVFVTLWAARFNPWNLDLLGYLSFGAGLSVLFAAAGLFEIFQWLSNRLRPPRAALRWIFPVAAGIFAFFLAAKDWARADLHDNFWPQKVARETLESLPPNAVIFYSADRLLTPALYQQGALGQRPDVAILLINLFVDPILAGQTRTLHPDLVLDSLETKGTAQSRLRAAFRNFCRENKRPIFTLPGDHLFDCRNFLPKGFVLQYRDTPVGPEVAAGVVSFVRQRFAGRMDFLSRDNFGKEILNWGAYLSELGARQAEELFSFAAQLDSENPGTWAALGRYYLFSGSSGLAETCLKLAVLYDPYDGDNFFLLAQALKRQGKYGEAEEAAGQAARLATASRKLNGPKKGPADK